MPKNPPDNMTRITPDLLYEAVASAVDWLAAALTPIWHLMTIRRIATFAGTLLGLALTVGPVPGAGGESVPIKAWARFVVLALMPASADAAPIARKVEIDTCASDFGAIFVKKTCDKRDQQHADLELALCASKDGLLAVRAKGCPSGEDAVSDKALHQAALCRQSGQIQLDWACDGSGERVVAKDLVLCAKTSGLLGLRADRCVEQETYYGTLVSGVRSGAHATLDYTPRAVVEHPEGAVQYAIPRQGLLGPTAEFVHPRSVIRLRVATESGLKETHWYRTFAQPLGFWRPDWMSLPDPTTDGVPPSAWTPSIPLAVSEDDTGMPEALSFVGHRDLADVPQVGVSGKLYALHASGRTSVQPQAATLAVEPELYFLAPPDFDPRATISRVVDGQRRIQVFGIGSFVTNHRGLEIRLMEMRRAGGPWSFHTHHDFEGRHVEPNHAIVDFQIGAQGAVPIDDDRAMVFAKARVAGGRLDLAADGRDRIYVIDIEGDEAVWKNLGSPPTGRGPLICGGLGANCDDQHVWRNTIIGAPLPIAYVNPSTGDLNLTVLVVAEYRDYSGGGGYEPLGYRVWARTMDRNGWNRDGWKRLAAHTGIEHRRWFELTSAAVWWLGNEMRVNVFGHTSPLTSGVDEHQPGQMIHLWSTWHPQQQRLDWHWDMVYESPDGTDFRTDSMVVVDYTDQNYIAVFGRTAGERIFEGSWVQLEDGTYGRQWQWTDLTPSP